MEFVTKVAVNLQNPPPITRIRFGDEAVGTRTELLCPQHLRQQLFREIKGPQLVALDQISRLPRLVLLHPERFYFRYQPVKQLEAAEGTCRSCTRARSR